jgi:hypothetical protein
MGIDILPFKDQRFIDNSIHCNSYSGDLSRPCSLDNSWNNSFALLILIFGGRPVASDG